MIKVLNLYDIVIKLTGEVKPIGDESVDVKREENLANLIDLAEEILAEIKEVESMPGSEDSIKRCRKMACKFTEDLREEYLMNNTW